MTLRAVSLLSDATTPFLRDTLAACAARTGVSIHLDDSAAWTQREGWLDEGQVDLVFLCGLLCARKLAAGAFQGRLVAAPVMQAARYAGKAIYFSDVVVRRSSGLASFADLRGARLAFNDPGSYSGWEIVRWHLSTLGVRSGFFSQLVESGSHLSSLEIVQSGKADAAAIDSMVWDATLERHPSLAETLCVAATLGPSPAPPLAFSRRLPPEVAQALSHAFLTMHETAEGASLLSRHRALRFDPVLEADYGTLLTRAEAGAQVSPV